MYLSECLSQLAKLIFEYFFYGWLILFIMGGPFLKVIRTSTPVVSFSVELVYEIICLYNAFPDDQNASRMFAFFLIGFPWRFFLILFPCKSIPCGG